MPPFDATFETARFVKRQPNKRILEKWEDISSWDEAEHAHQQTKYVADDAKLKTHCECSCRSASWCPTLARTFAFIAAWMTTFLITYALFPTREEAAGLIEGQLLTFSKDTIGLRDFALAFSGGEIVADLTSPTFVPKPLPAGYVPVSPVSAITPGLQPGTCWPLAGSSGYIGVHLSERVVVANVTIDHVARDLAPDFRTAPKNMTLWGMRDSDSPHGAPNDLDPLFADNIDMNWNMSFPISSPLAHKFVPLVSFSYDVMKAAFIQTYDVNSTRKMLTNVVVLQIHNNWGNPAKTCLYRLRVHGCLPTKLLVQ